MPDWSKAILKHREEFLRPDEEIRATLLFLPAGGLKKVGIAGGIGGALGSAGAAAGMRAGSKKAMDGVEPSDDAATMAETFPVCFGFLTVTSERILVFDRGSAATKRPQRVVGEYPLGAITDVESSKSFMKRTVTFTFSDGSQLTVDGGMAQPYDRFAEAIGG